MPKAKRNIGPEILQGLRELKHGEYGRVTTVPSVTSIRNTDGLVPSEVPLASESVSANASGLGARLSRPVGSRKNPAYDCP